MIRLFEFRDLERIMEIWLEGNLKAHPFIKEEYWRQNYETVRSVLPNAEVYVFEEDGGGPGLYWHGRRIYCRIICSGGTPGTGIGHQLISEVKRKSAYHCMYMRRIQALWHSTGQKDSVLKTA